MAEQWQLRKGSTAENEGFVGAEGELTYDTTTKAVHVHDGETAGGALIDAVVAYQLPTSANNYTWYRLYASGWVEQGGKGQVTTNGLGNTFTLPITMSNTNYTITAVKWAGDTGNVGFQAEPSTTTQFKAGVAYSSALTRNFTWEVKGMAA